MKHHTKKHSEYVEGCQPCKWNTLTVATIPGSHREGNIQAGMRQMDKNLNRYRAKKQAGESPRSITKEGMDKSEKLEATWTDNEKQIVDNNSPEAVREIKKTLLNQ